MTGQENKEKHLFIFLGARAAFPSGVFDDFGLALAWIRKNGLSGVLTEYPLNTGVYEWAIEKKYFIPAKEYQLLAPFKEKFTSASMNHWHFEKGETEG